MKGLIFQIIILLSLVSACSKYSTKTNISKGSQSGGKSHSFSYQLVDRKLSTIPYLANPTSNSISTSSDGKWIVFDSSEYMGGGLVVEHQIYLFNSTTQETKLISRSASGAGDGSSIYPLISGDGKTIIFFSKATNLDINEKYEPKGLFLYKVDEDKLSHIAFIEGAGNQVYDLSDDGVNIVFVSEAVLVPEDTNELSDVYLYHGGDLKRLSVSSVKEEQANEGSLSVSISGDGQMVSFISNATNLIDGMTLSPKQQAYYRNLDTGKLDFVGSIPEANGDSVYQDMTPDGKFVVFQSRASNLVPDDNNNVTDIFLMNNETKELTRVSLSSTGNEGALECSNPSISDDGTLVVFDTATAFDPFDMNTTVDIYLKDLRTGEIKRISTDPRGLDLNQPSSKPVISGDGKKIIFQTTASNVMPIDNGLNHNHVYMVGASANWRLRLDAELSGTPGNNGVDADYFMSTDGAHVVFSSNSTNLVLNDSNATADIFQVKVNHQIEAMPVIEGMKRISIGQNLTETNQASYHPSVSDDGRYVAFISHATNLVSDDTNGVPDVFVRDDLKDGEIIRESVGQEGQEANSDSKEVKISRDGEWLVFYSAASNLIADDRNNANEVFRRDRKNKINERVATWQDGSQANQESLNPQIGKDGTFVSFMSTENLLVPNTLLAYNVFLKDFSQNQMSLISRSNRKNELDGGVFRLAMPYNSNQLFIETDAGLTVTRGKNTLEDKNTFSDVYQLDISEQIFKKLSFKEDLSESSARVFLGHVSDEGNKYQLISEEKLRNTDPDSFGHYLYSIKNSDTFSELPVLKLLNQDSAEKEIVNINGYDRLWMSGGEGWTFFASPTLMPNIDNEETGFGLYSIDETFKGALSLKVPDSHAPNGGSWGPSLSTSGRFVSFISSSSNLVESDNNNNPDIFVTDLETSLTTRVSVNTDKEEANSGSTEAMLSGDGQLVVFRSQASNLVPGDSTNDDQIFLRDRTLNVTLRISENALGIEGNGGSFFPFISSNGKFVTFSSWANNLVEGDTNNDVDIFLKNLVTHQITRISLTSTQGEVSGGDMGRASVSNDGRYVAFTSRTDGLVADDSNGDWDVFLRDTQEGTTIRIAEKAMYPSITPDGEWIVFNSASDKLVEGDTNNRSDAFIYHRKTGTIKLVSKSTAGDLGNADIEMTRPVTISDDGQFVLFSSYATNLVDHDTNEINDYFVRDVKNNTTTRIGLGDSGQETLCGIGESYLSGDGQNVAFSSKDIIFTKDEQLTSYQSRIYRLKFAP